MIAPLAWIQATGARCPLGLGTLQIALCARAKKLEPTSSSLTDQHGHSIGYALTRGLPERLAGYDRLLALAVPALIEAWPTELTTPIPLVLALPEAGRADDDPRFATELFGALASRSGARIDAGRSLAIRAGRAGGALAIEAALRILEGPGAPAAVMVGGLDGHVHPGVLRDLDRQGRLHSPATDDGFIPSEGAAFLLLSPTPALLARRSPLASLARVATGIEGSASTDEPNLAAALTRVVRAAVGEGLEQPARWVLNDINGEHDRLREWAMVEVRVLAGSEAVTGRMVEELGEIGAATGPMLAVIACGLWAAGCAPAPEVVVALSSDGRERGAFRLEAPR